MEALSLNKLFLWYNNIMKTTEELLKMSGNDLLKYCESLKYFTIDYDNFYILTISDIILTKIEYDKAYKHFKLSYHFENSNTYDNDFERATKIYKHFVGRIKIAFGIGTFLSNDTDVGALNIVMKVVKANGYPTCKLTDNPEKAMGDNQEYIDFVKRSVDWRIRYGK